MATQKFSKFVRPEAARSGPVTDRDLDILDVVLRFGARQELPSKDVLVLVRRIALPPLPTNGRRPAWLLPWKLSNSLHFAACISSAAWVSLLACAC
jgi:hypothetical protein